MMCAARMTSSFIRSNSVVPPARYWLAAWTAPAWFTPLSAWCARMAASASSMRVNWNGCMSALLHHGFGLVDCVHDVGIGRAAAEIAAHVFADLHVALDVAFLHACDGGHDLAGCAVAALEGVVIDERLLHRMQRAWSGKAFNRGDVLAVEAGRERQA